jgi:hypothetical protein
VLLPLLLLLLLLLVLLLLLQPPQPPAPSSAHHPAQGMQLLNSKHITLRLSPQHLQQNAVTFHSIKCSSREVLTCIFKLAGHEHARHCNVCDSRINTGRLTLFKRMIPAAASAAAVFCSHSPSPSPAPLQQPRLALLSNYVGGALTGATANLTATGPSTCSQAPSQRINATVTVANPGPGLCGGNGTVTVRHVYAAALICGVSSCTHAFCCTAEY